MNGPRAVAMPAVTGCRQEGAHPGSSNLRQAILGARLGDPSRRIAATFRHARHGHSGTVFSKKTRIPVVEKSTGRPRPKGREVGGRGGVPASAQSPASALRAPPPRHGKGDGACRRRASTPAQTRSCHRANGSAGNATSSRSDSASSTPRPRMVMSDAMATSRVSSSARSVLSRSRARSQSLRA